ncbi:hypothetical protein QBC42DRAFT_288799 [Cladorrhinum samala]|uniref:Uncharacterized protein n=1 Tax=Cladorrhinum samala TaxID=585594 RepID=A0AAV9HH28_9PEZI|nr:hypothetical protein QBC42DRAFT_288799 [Cladorrhinum samala]
MPPTRNMPYSAQNLDQDDVHHQFLYRRRDERRDRILAIRKEHMPANLQHLFLPDDLVLFQHRRHPESINPTRREKKTEPGPWTSCGGCIADFLLIDAVAFPMFVLFIPAYLLGCIGLPLVPRIPFKAVPIMLLLWLRCKYLWASDPESNSFNIFLGWGRIPKLQPQEIPRCKGRHFLRSILKKDRDDDLFVDVGYLSIAWSISTFNSYWKLVTPPADSRFGRWLDSSSDDYDGPIERRKTFLQDDAALVLRLAPWPPLFNRQEDLPGWLPLRMRGWMMRLRSLHLHYKNWQRALAAGRAYAELECRGYLQRNPGGSTTSPISEDGGTRRLALLPPPPPPLELSIRRLEGQYQAVYLEWQAKNQLKKWRG